MSQANQLRMKPPNMDKVFQGFRKFFPKQRSRSRQPVQTPVQPPEQTPVQPPEQTPSPHLQETLTALYEKMMSHIKNLEEAEGIVMNIQTKASEPSKLKYKRIHVMTWAKHIRDLRTAYHKLEIIFDKIQMGGVTPEFLDNLRLLINEYHAGMVLRKAASVHLDIMFQLEQIRVKAEEKKLQLNKEYQMKIQSLIERIKLFIVNYGKDEFPKNMMETLSRFRALLDQYDNQGRFETISLPASHQSRKRPPRPPPLTRSKSPSQPPLTRSKSPSQSPPRSRTARPLPRPRKLKVTTDEPTSQLDLVNLIDANEFTPSTIESTPSTIESTDNPVLSQLKQKIRDDIKDLDIVHASLSKLLKHGLSYEDKPIDVWVSHIDSTLRKYNKFNTRLQEFEHTHGSIEPNILNSLLKMIESEHEDVMKYKEVLTIIEEKHKYFLLGDIHRLLLRATNLKKSATLPQEKMNTIIQDLTKLRIQCERDGIPDHLDETVEKYQKLLIKLETESRGERGTTRYGTTFGGNGSKKK
jgi:hypothetical protein